MSTTPFFTEPVFEPAPEPREATYGEEDYIRDEVEREFGDPAEVERIAEKLYVRVMSNADADPPHEGIASWSFRAAAAFVKHRAKRRETIEAFRQAERDREPS